MLLRRSTLLAAILSFTLLAVPAIASAKDYCFGDGLGCSSQGFDDSELALAFTEAESNGTDDRFFLSPPAQFANGPFSYQSAERVDIIGAGAGQTILQSGAAGSVLALGGNPDSSVRDLTVKPVGSATAGLQLTGTHAQGVAVDATAAASLLAGVIASGGASFDDGSVDVGSAQMMPAVLVLGSSATVTDSRLVAPKGYGVFATGTAATVRRSTLDAKFGATASAGHLTVSDTLIDLRGKGSNASGNAIAVSVGPDGAATTAEADLDRLTIVGSTPNTVETIGVSAGANGATQSATIHLRDSVISGIGIPLARQGINGATVTLSTDRSLYPQPVFALDGGPGSLVEERRLSGNPGFVDDAGGDFHPTVGSPLIDAGTPGELPSGTADRDGNPRPSDGDGDGTAVSDVGAYELPGTTAGTPATATPAAATAAPLIGPSAPVLSRLKVSPTRIAIGTQLPKLLVGAAKSPAGTIRFTLTKAARVELRFARVGRRGAITRIKPRVRIKARRGANRVRFAARLNRRLRLKSGVYRLTAIAIDSAGARSKPATTRFTAIQPKRR